MGLAIGLGGFIFTNALKPKVKAVSDQSPSFEVTRLSDQPIISTEMHHMLVAEADSFGYRNINGPSLIKVPDWLENPLGQYYLYFAHHKGGYIRMAYADSLDGVWTIADNHILPLKESGLLTEAGKVSGLETLRKYTSISETLALVTVASDYKKDYEQRQKEKVTATNPTEPHLASPDIIVDDDKQEIRMYYHGVVDGSLQMSKVALSKDGLNFTPEEGILSLPYLRVFEYRDQYYGLAMPGFIYRSDDGLKDFEVRKRWVFDPKSRHYGIHFDGTDLYIFHTKVGDAPEVIYYTRMDMSSADWDDWTTETLRELMRPELDWEGANLPVKPSMRGESGIPVNELRDPDVFKDADGQLYILYSGQGEQHIGIARLEMKK